MDRPTIPSDPLARFLEIAQRLEDRRRWWQGAQFLRYAAVALITSEGSARRVAEEVVTAADTLKQHAGWFGTLNSDVRFVVAAMLVREGADAARFHQVLEGGCEAFRRVGLRRGQVHESLAVLLLWLGQERQRLTDVTARRFRDVLDAMKQHHPWITGANDYPACALLTLRDERMHRQMQRIERFYDGLRAEGLSIGGSLQLVSHLLYFNPAADDVVLRRFVALRSRFRGSGVQIWPGDHDELAILTYLDKPARRIVDTVLRHREAVRRLRPKPDANLSFSLASATGFLELLGGDIDARARDAQTLVQVQQILAAQQAAIAACAAASVVATSCGGS